VLIWLVVTYNNLVKKDEKVTFQWNEVQNAYQRRLDLIPNIVNTVKGGAEYEQNVLREVTEARSNAQRITVTGVNANAYAQQSAAQDALASAANRLIIAVERYPDIKGTRAFRDLQTQLEGTERRIKVARVDFNESVADYNSSVRRFPTKIVAGLFSFPAKEGFQSVAGADKSVEIKF
jgi:LemA protein